MQLHLKRIIICAGVSLLVAPAHGQVTVAGTTGFVAATVAGPGTTTTNAATAAATVAGTSVAATVAGTTGFVAATVAGTDTVGTTGFVAATVAGPTATSTSAATAAATVGGVTAAATVAGPTATTSGDTGFVAATVAGVTAAATVAGPGTTATGATAAATVAGTTNLATTAATVSGVTAAATVAGTTNAATAAATVSGVTAAATVAGTTNAATAAATVSGVTAAATVAGTTNAATAAATVSGVTAAATVAGTTNAATAAATVSGVTAAATVAGTTNAATVAATVSGVTAAATVEGTTNAATVAATVSGSTGFSTDAATVAATVSGSTSTDAATVAATVAGSTSSTGFTTQGSTGEVTSSSLTGRDVTVSTATSTSAGSSSTGEQTVSSASSSSSSTGNVSSSSSGGFKEEEKNELKARLRPLFHLNFDYGSYIVNLTPQFNGSERSIVSYDYKPMASSDALVYGDFRDGFQKTVYGSIEVGIGAQVKFWFDNATGLRQYFWGYVGVLPILGKETESVRYVSTLDKAYAMGGRWVVPKDASDLDRWDPGDSITYVGQGGIIFSAGAGLGPVGVGVAKLATGTWETYVEKVGSNKAYVKMTRGKLSNFSMFTNVSILTLSLSEFKYADDGFSFLFDLSTDTGRKAYEDMIRGNVLASENFANDRPVNYVERAPVLKVETFRSVSTGRIASRSLALPIIWDKTYSRGRVNSFTTSDLHLDRNTARVHYGIFSDVEDSRFFFKHKERHIMFYGAKYSVENWDSKARMDSMFGTFSYAFRHEKSNGQRLRAGIRELIKRTGLDTLMVRVPDRDLGYTGIEFNVNFSEENTLRLMMAAQRLTQDQFIDKATDLVYPYFAENNDPYDYCMIDANLPGSCQNKLSRRTAVAASKMYYALKKMYKYMNSDAKAFAAAYGEFGEGMSENAFTFKAALNMAGPGVGIDYLIEGTYISMYFREWNIDARGRWVPMIQSPRYKGLPFRPETRHSRVRGMIIGNSDAGKVPHMTPVSF